MSFQASLLNELITTWCINLMFYSRYQAKMNTIPRREGGHGGRDEIASGADLSGSSKYLKIVILETCWP